MRASLLGSAARNAHCIRIEANLLADWLSDRASARATLRRQTAKLAVVGICTICAYSGGQRLLVPLKGKLGTLKQDVAALDREIARRGLDRAQPTALEEGLNGEQWLDKTRQRARAFSNAAASLMNAGTGSMFLNNLRLQVANGAMTAVGQGDAVNFESANEFVKRLALVPDSRNSALTSTTRSTALGANGVTFQFQHSAEVKK